MPRERLTISTNLGGARKDNVILHYKYNLGKMMWLLEAMLVAKNVGKIVNIEEMDYSYG